MTKYLEPMRPNYSDATPDIVRSEYKEVTQEEFVRIWSSAK